jgi:hypothetical protein
MDNRLTCMTCAASAVLTSDTSASEAKPKRKGLLSRKK